MASPFQNKILSYLEKVIEVLEKDTNLKEVINGIIKSLIYHYRLRNHMRYAASAVIKIIQGEAPSRKEILGLIGLIEWVPYFAGRSFDLGRREGTQFLNALDRIKAKRTNDTLNDFSARGIEALLYDLKGMNQRGNKFFTDGGHTNNP